MTYPQLIYSNVKSLETFPLRSDSKQGCSHLPLLFKIVLEFLITVYLKQTRLFPHIIKQLSGFLGTYGLRLCHSSNHLLSSLWLSPQNHNMLIEPPLSHPNYRQEEGRTVGHVSLVYLFLSGKQKLTKQNSHLHFTNENCVTRPSLASQKVAKGRCCVSTLIMYIILKNMPAIVAYPYTLIRTLK